MIVNVQICFTDDKEDQKDALGDFLHILCEGLYECMIDGKYCYDGKDEFENKFYISRPLSFEE